jgi:beta-glucosidase
VSHRSHRYRRFAVLSAVTALTLGLATAPPSSAHRSPDHTEQHTGRTLPYQNRHLPTSARVADLLGRMTLAEKIGQMTQAERIDVDADPSLITRYALGSVLSGGGSAPTPNTPQAWADMVDRYQRAALRTRLGIPLIYGVDAVHGHGNMLGATVFPHNIGLGASRDARLVEEVYHATAIETRASGIPWDFAPCLCVARDDRWGRTYESFGEDPRLVARLGGAAIDGLQGHRGELDERDRVLATAKHFAGDGLTTYDESLAGTGAYPIDQGIAEVSRADFDRLALSPYVPAVLRHDVGSVMPSYSSVDFTEDGLGNRVKMHANRALITGWLKGRLGFDGFVISDWRAIRQLPGDYRAQVQASVLAGVDMFMEPIQAPNNPTGWDEFIPTLTALVDDGSVPVRRIDDAVRRIDDAVRRILTAKFELGLFEHPFADRTLIGKVGGREHHALAREAAAESQVLLTNKDRTLPLRDRQPVYVAGSNADNIGNQTGGWTLTWQGGSTNVVPGTTILDGIEQQARDVTFSADASAPVPRGAAGVVVVGETPYAEGFGDVGGPRWAYDPADNGVPRQPQTMELSDADRAAIETVCAAAVRCTVLVVSGRPIVIPPEVLADVDALVASWLPGSEGAGVADVLFGDRPFTGKLPVTWPRSVDQEPINAGDTDDDPLFPYGWGLTTRR